MSLNNIRGELAALHVSIADVQRQIRSCRQCGRRPERLSVGHQQAAVPDPPHSGP